MLALIALCAVFCINNAIYVGPITIKENGKDVTRYVVTAFSKDAAEVSGSTVKVKYNGNVQIAKTANNSYSPNMFQEYRLAGKTVTFTADLSNVGCSCDAAFYFVSMPGYGSNGQPTPGQWGAYYCDANDVNGVWCWEMDVMEANKYALAVTPHKCSQKPGGYISSCDKAGCGTNPYYSNKEAFGPSSSYKIDTTQAFTVSVNFGSSIEVTLKQGSNSFQFQDCSNNGGYVSDMNEAFDYGMVLVMSYFGGSYNDFSWLDGMTGCQGNCPQDGYAIYSDIEIS